jgi:hypothetical protein
MWIQVLTLGKEAGIREYGMCGGYVGAEVRGRGKGRSGVDSSETIFVGGWAGRACWAVGHSFWVLLYEVL